jgi:5-methylcytosine-specific restriction enzyme A
MAFWIFKYDPEKYRLPARLLDPNPTTSWTVSRFRDEIAPGDTVFLWQTGQDRGIRAVLRVNQAPRDMAELESEQRYWSEPDRTICCRILGTLTHRAVDLSAQYLRQVPGLEQLSVFHGFQQATNFPVTPEQGEILLRLVEQDTTLPREAVPSEGGSLGTNPALNWPTFEVGRVYSRRVDIHRLYGGQQQGGICTPTRVRCLFLFTGPGGEQHGYRDGWNEDGVFLYTGEGQSGDMAFVRGNLAIRDHAANGRDLHVFESVGREGNRYVGRFDCVGWEYRRGPDTAGQDRRVIVFHLLPEEEVGTTEPQEQAVGESPPAPLEELRRRALAAVRPPAERPARDARRLYHERSAAVRTYVLARAKGVCEACRKPAPFRRPDGTPYLEPHHTRRVADGGPDHPRWVGGVCPNCHQEVHHGEHGHEVNRRLEEYLGTVESHEES